jgi:tRNA pseudouridine55 synthase
MSFPSGFFVVDKPSGVTSFSMVALVRRLTGVRRVGHAGTLDPLASGVLPVAVGQAARLIEYMDDARKTYVARVRFGVETDTYDAEGDVVATGDASGVTAEVVEAALAGFVGEIEQAPPAYSAIKVEGKPLYRYARAGEAVEARPRRVVVERITLLGFGQGTLAADDGAGAGGAKGSGGDIGDGGVLDAGRGKRRPYAESGGDHGDGGMLEREARILPLAYEGAVDAEIEVVCGKGTYIRSIAHDLGRKLGCRAHLAALRRTSSGGFGVGDAIAPERLVELAEAGKLEEALLAPDRAVERRRAAIVGEDRASDVIAGRDIELELRVDVGSPAEGEICRAYDVGGRFLGVLASRAGGGWHPTKVLAGP